MTGGRRTRAAEARRAFTAERLDGLSLPKGPAWADQARREALGRIEAMGLPMPRDEYWRWTDPRALTSAEVAEAPPLVSDETPVFEGVDRLRIVFVDGAFRADLSDPLEMAGLEIGRLADDADIHWAKGLMGELEAMAHDPVERPLAALNTATATDGILIRATGAAARPVSLIYRHEGESSEAVLRHVVRVEPGASLTVLEDGPAAARFNLGLEVDVAAGGAFHHVRVQGRDAERRALTHVFARLGADATFKSFTLTANGVLTRNEVVMTLAGDGGTGHVAGAALGNGAAFLHDDTVFVTHDAEGCESRQVFKKVLRNGATGVFQGKILVKEGAQRTDGYQISQSLLLDEDAVFLAKPELEIYADDVQCSHGSTSGAIDEMALYYLRSRGLPRGEAEDLLTLSFLAEALDEIEDDGLAEHLRTRVADWLRDR